ncbi:MAG: glycosyltransferase family 88 protein [Candidatus Berkiella sp.]
MWQVDLSKHFKIWFSDNKNSFLGVEDQLRLVKTRADNPDAKLSFVYSEGCLSQKALGDLKKFCEKQRVTPINFDSEVLPLLSDENDKKLYELALLEIKNCLADEGGSMAAASDCARFIRPLLAKLGTYTDFDVQVKTQGKKFVETKALVLIPYVDAEPFGSFNTDILVASCDPLHPEQLSKEAKERIGYVQDQIIEKHTNTTAMMKAFFLGTIKGLQSDIMTKPAALQFINYFVATMPNPSIFQIRKAIKNITALDYIKSLPISDRIVQFGTHDCSDLTEAEAHERYVMALQIEKEEMTRFSRIFGLPRTAIYSEEPAQIVKILLTTMKHSAYVFSVCAMSGPSNIMAMFRDDYSPSLTVRKTPGIVYCYPSQECDKLKKAMNDSSLKENKLDQHFNSKNSMSYLRPGNTTSQSDPLKEVVGKFGDQSWTTLGKQNKKDREGQIQNAASKLQKWWARTVLPNLHEHKRKQELEKNPERPILSNFTRSRSSDQVTAAVASSSSAHKRRRM